MYDYNFVYSKTLEYFKGDDLAAKKWIEKYCLKNKKGELLESSPKDMHLRLSAEFFRIESNYPNPISQEKIFNLLNEFKYIIPQGSPMYGIGNNESITSLSNCFVIGSHDDSDSYGSIMKTDEEQIQLMKRRGGVGHDLSHLRPAGSLANNSVLGGKAGSTLYMGRYSNSTREVAQDGRRGALMLSVSVKHPDTERFIDVKLEQGKVTGANISVKIDDEFMEAVNKDEDFIQTFPIDLNINTHTPFIEELLNGKIKYGVLYPLEQEGDNGFKGCYAKRIKARDLWNKIIKNAWQSAEPGILFWDRVVSESPADVYADLGFKTVSTNPCFTGDTIIAIADGRNGVSIKELAEIGNNFLVYSARPRRKGGWKTEIKEAKAFKTGVKKVIKIYLSDGSSFKCTPDHLLALPNNEYIEAKDSLQKELSKFSNKNIDLSGNVKVVKIEECGIEDVYDLNVEDNHNFYIITKTDDENFLNSSGVLVHNCGEIPLCPYDSCRLLALNLYSYVENPFTDKAKFNFELFKEHSRIAQRLMDDLVDLEIEKIEKILDKINSDPEPDYVKKVEKELWEKIKEKSIYGRRTGLGITAEGDMLAAMGLKYGSKEAIEFSVNVHKTLAVESYKESIDLARTRGSFPICDSTMESVGNGSEFLNRIYNELPIGYQLDWEVYGRRNISNLTIAPTGTTSLMSQTTSGVEPLFSPFYKRRAKTDDPKRITFTDEVGDTWEEFFVIHPKFVKWFEVNYWDKVDDHLGVDSPGEWLSKCNESVLQKYFELSPYYEATANDIDWVSSVKMQGEIQKWVDHSISKTVNVPNKTSIDVVGDIYLSAWKNGCKGVTIYRDGSRSGVLVNTDSKKENKSEFNYTDAFKRPKVTDCDIYHKRALKKNWILMIGKVNGHPFEIFNLQDSEEGILPKNLTKGKITRIKRKVYKFEGVSSDGKKYVIDNIITYMSEDERVSTLKYSALLRHGMHPKFIIKMIDKFATIISFDKVVQWGLRHYVTDLQKPECPNCGSNNYHSHEGCWTCQDCGFSKCG